MLTQESIPPVVPEVGIFWFIRERGTVPKLICDTWDEMRPNVPQVMNMRPNVLRVMFEYAERETGLRQDPVYRERPCRCDAAARLVSMPRRGKHPRQMWR
jgi:hypothetical protein